MRQNLISLLDHYNATYFETPFIAEDFFALGKPESRDRPGTYRQNLYLSNLNAARNWGLEYGIAAIEFDWILPLDSNSFFTTEMWQRIESGISPEDEILVLPQIRVNRNEDILRHDFPWKHVSTFEPQIGFHRKTSLRYNPMLPYGGAPKAGLLRVCGVPGPWQDWRDNERDYGVPDRKRQHVRFKTVGGVIRLSSQNSEV